MSTQLVHIAWRNLWRNPRRTLISMVAIALGYTMLLVFTCLLHGLSQQMIDNGTRFGLSHVQVHAPDYYPERSIYKTLGGRTGTPVRELLATIRADPRVQAAAPRLYGYGLVSGSQHSAGAELLGVVPSLENTLSAFHTRVVKGQFLSQRLPYGVVLGERLASTIQVDVGSDVVMMTQAADGSLGNDLYTVVGIIRTGSEATDRNLVLMPLASLQELLSLGADRIHEIGIAVSDAPAASPTAERLETQLGKIVPVRVRAWPDLSPALAEYVRLSQGNTTVLFWIVFLVAVIGVMNTMLMAVFERTREFGVLMAIGMQPAYVLSLILAEAGILVSLSLCLGGGIGAPLVWYLQVYGLDLQNIMGELSMAGVVIDPIWYGRQDFDTYGRAAMGLAGVALVSALYPALRAARFRPVEAMRQV